MLDRTAWDVSAVFRQGWLGRVRSFGATEPQGRKLSEILPYAHEPELSNNRRHLTVARKAGHWTEVTFIELSEMKLKTWPLFLEACQLMYLSTCVTDGSKVGSISTASEWLANASWVGSRSHVLACRGKIRAEDGRGEASHRKGQLPSMEWPLEEP
jgi:hypothetical protein